jgi:DNA (cytosine-5)-methyltransferase 1
MIPSTVSLFCGAGGESAGKELAFRELGLDSLGMLSHAFNHWDLAVAAHGRNFPHIHVHQEDITAITAADFGLQHINLLWASPSCVHHSRARGGKPREEQQRSHAWEVVDRWLNHNGGHGFHGQEVWRMRRVGKAKAGRLLDGIEHNGYPEVH